MERRRFTADRRGLTHKFQIGEHEGYATVSLFDDGKVGELFVTMSKEGSTVAGLMDTIGILTSVALQSGVELETLAEKFRGSRFEPRGHTPNKDIPFAESVVDYLFRWMESVQNERKKNDPAKV